MCTGTWASCKHTFSLLSEELNWITAIHFFNPIDLVLLIKLESSYLHSRDLTNALPFLRFLTCDTFCAWIFVIEIMRPKCLPVIQVFFKRVQYIRSASSSPKSRSKDLYITLFFHSVLTQRPRVKWSSYLHLTTQHFHSYWRWSTAAPWNELRWMNEIGWQLCKSADCLSSAVWRQQVYLASFVFNSY